MYAIYNSAGDASTKRTRLTRFSADRVYFLGPRRCVPGRFITVDEIFLFDHQEEILRREKLGQLQLFAADQRTRVDVRTLEPTAPPALPNRGEIANNLTLANAQFAASVGIPLRPEYGLDYEMVRRVYGEDPSAHPAGEELMGTLPVDPLASETRDEAFRTAASEDDGGVNQNFFDDSALLPPDEPVSAADPVVAPPLVIPSTGQKPAQGRSSRRRGR
jgi:hypothetical protein